jgi:hypothetical protein
MNIESITNELRIQMSTQFVAFLYLPVVHEISYHYTKSYNNNHKGNNNE